jgi:hypothetical protein
MHQILCAIEIIFSDLESAIQAKDNKKHPFIIGCFLLEFRAQNRAQEMCD